MHSETRHTTPRSLRQRALIVGSVVTLALLTTGCETMAPHGKGTAVGAGIGAVAGAAIGSMTGGKNTVRGAALGAVAGAIAGNVWSKRMEDQRRAMEAATQGTPVEVTRTADNQLRLDIPNDISFATGSAAIKPELRGVLDAFAKGLNSGGSGTLVRVVGHTDSTGGDAINNPLSLDRAQSVRNFLQDRGIAASRIDVVGRGSREPVASNETAEGRAENRRVEIFMRDPVQVN
jgi:outer membrane protein OmpA-like peptidoglycan-associated protein